MKTPIVGRLKELGILRELLKTSKAELLAIYGRRRVGKTFLVRNFFENEPCKFFYCSGLKEGKIADQLDEFSKQIGKTFYNGASIAIREKWLDVFEDLNKALEQIPKGKKVVLFFDELPWMATPRSKLLQALDYYWNRYWSHNQRLKLIICGSSASWIINNIINNKGGLYNRVTRTISLEPFSLKEVNLFLSNQGLRLSQNQVLEIYMILGGIPYYLNLLRKSLSIAQNIDELCFQKNGALVREFERLFSSLFDNSETYISLIRVIAKYTYGVGQAQLIKESRAPDGGGTKRKLKELENAGFIDEFIPLGHQGKGVYYRVIDEFTLFYLKWMEPNLRTILKQSQSGDYWLAKIKSPHWRSWAGLAFESICYKHLAQIQKALNIPAGADVGVWRYAPRKQDYKGAQIDLLIDRTDKAVTICEIRFNEQPFSIDKDYAYNLINKIETYKKLTKTTKQLFLAMIVASGLKPSMYSEEIVHNVVTLEDFFK